MNVNKSPSFKAVIIEPSFIRYMKDSDIPKMKNLMRFMRKHKNNDFFIDALSDRSVKISIMKTNPLTGYLDKDLFQLSKEEEGLVYAMKNLEDVYKATHKIEDPVYEGYIHPDTFTPKEMVKLVKAALTDFNKIFNSINSLN